MKQRIISSLIMLPLLTVIWLGNWWLLAIGLIASAIGLKELNNGFEKAGYKPSLLLEIEALILLYGLHILTMYTELIDRSTALNLWFAAVIIGSLVYGFKVEERKLGDIPATLLSIVYVEYLFYHIVLIDQSESRILVWLVFLSAFGTDIFAYFVGVTLGKHKLCPKLSPKKSIEGATGGVLGSIFLCLSFGYFLATDYLLLCGIIGTLGSVVAQLGDLSASALKRQMGIKDYGDLIPGHGGILDRFDSVLFVAPVVYYAIIIFS